MVGLSDIPIVGKAVDMISEASVKAAYRGFRYMFCCKDLVNVLNSEIEKINIQENMVSKKVVEENESGKIVEGHVYKWQKEVKEIQEDSKKISEKYKNRRPITNPLSRFRLGREAVQKANKVAQLMESGKELVTNPIAHLPPVENLPKTDSVFQDFPSRKVVYDKIWQSLITEDSPRILGIYGLPGVGKTRIAEQIWKEAKEKGIFNKVTKAVVSGEKDLDVKRLQKELARDLNCHFESQDDIKHRASQLKHSIMYGDKVLVILDDVWREIPLHDIGIPIGDDTTSKGCKILFTSREKKVCLDNNCIDPVEITALTVVEAWDMFKDSVGKAKIEYLPDESLAKQVCNKCGGLPLLIRAVGKALRNMSGNVWKDALDQLQKYKIECIPGIDPEVYACLKLSFDNLVKDAKACLLLSSLYPEDAYISTSMLIELGIGSKLLPGGRSRVLSMVDTLKSSSLIIVNEFTTTFKLHDVIRDVARSIAVKDYAFLFAGSDLSLPHINGSPNLLCLDVKNNNNFYFPRDMIYHGLYTLWIESTSIGIHIFKVWEVAGTFVNLECLVLRNIEWEEQSPVEQLGKLRTLVLVGCDIQKTDFSFISENLETLCVWYCSLPVPLDILNLKYLRKLEILKYVETPVLLVANTISSLSSTLEELHIPYGYRYQKKQNDEVNNSSISMELSRLTRLKSLKMEFPASERIQDPKLFSNLSEFQIRVGCAGSIFPQFTRWIRLDGNQVEAAAFVSFIERAEGVKSYYTDVDVSSIFNSNRQAFSDLKVLIVEGSDTMEHLARIQPHHQIQPSTSFSQLYHLSITDCSKMKYLFCNSVAKCLVQLQYLSVENCTMMEAIIVNEGSRTDGEEEEDIIANFSRLKSLTLRDMPKLKGFNIDKKDMQQSTSTVAVAVSLKDNSAAIIPTLSLFSRQVAFPVLEALIVNGLTVSDIWGKHYYNDNASSFCKLKSLQVWSCTKLETVIPLDMLHKLGNLKYLRIDDCSSVVSEIGTFGNTTAVHPLVALTDMHLQKLPSVINTWLNSIPNHSQAITVYPNLKKLCIKECNSLSNVFLPSIAGDLMHLEDLHLDSCKMMTEIIGATAGDNITKDVFPNLMTCEIMYCDKIKLEDIEFWRGDFACQLKSLDLRCDKEIQLPSTWQLQIYNQLEKLTLCNCWWHEQQVFPCFSRLRWLKVTKSGRSTLFPFSVIISLQQLEEIEISDCAFLKDIMEEDVRGNGASSTDKKIIEFIQLKRVVLKDLPNLGRFMSGGDYECHMPALSRVEIGNCAFSTLFPLSVISSLQQLEEIDISNCAFLKDIVEEDVRGNGASSTDEKIIEFIQLKRVVLKNLPNLGSFMSGADYECHMPALSGVEIDNCAFTTLFTCCRDLQQLCSLEVRNCGLLEYVVKDTKNDEISEANDKFITLSQLWSIELKNLPNLKSFSRTSSYAFDMPELEHFQMLRCPQVENFTYMKTSTGGSVRVTSDWHREGEYVQDLNDYIKQNCKRGSNIISDSAGE